MSVSDIKFNLVSTFDEAVRFWNWVQEPHDWLAIDTETGGLDWWRDPLRLVQIGDGDAGWAIPWQGWGSLAKQAIENYRGPLVMHNSKFDLHFLESNGVRVPRHLLHDTMPMVGLLEPLLSKGLKAAGERHVFAGAEQGERMLQSVMAKNKWTWATIPVEVPEYWSYGALDVVITARLARKLFPQIQTKPCYQAYQYEVAVAQVLCDMERQGLLVSDEYIRRMQIALEREEDNLRDWFTSQLGIDNPLADRQLIRLFESYGYQFTEVTDKGNTKLDNEVLDQIMDRRPDLAGVATAVQNIRNYHKIRGTYFDAFLDLQDATGRLHTSINPMGARTGRMSSSRPNLQNVPARTQGNMVRSAFVAPEGSKLVSADFDQIEYRIMVSRAGEKRLIEAIQAGQDLHTYMTSVVYKKPMEDVQPRERSIMKNATFAFLYGAGDAKFARMAGIPLEEALAFRDLYTKEFPAIARYAADVASMGRGKGEWTTSYMGRVQAVADRDKAYKLLNYVTQGEAGDVLKRKLVELSNAGLEPYMRLPIHDEILFEVPEEEVESVVATIREVMPETAHFDVPLSVGVDVINSWGDKYA